MNIKNLSLKELLGKDWTFEPDFRYADVPGSAELYGGGNSMILFRKQGSLDVCAVKLHAVLNYDKTLFYVANRLMADMGLEIRMGDKLGRMTRKYGTPAFVYYLEEDYERYYWRYPSRDFYDSDFYDYNDAFYVVHYHYLLSPDLLVCFGAPRSDNRITDLEIVNDQKMVSEIMETRRAIKEYDRTLYQLQECRRFVKQTIEGGKISGIKSENIRFVKMKVENCCVEEIETKDIWFRECFFRNVTFDSHFESADVRIKQCTFIGCVFHDTFSDSYIDVSDSLFRDCLFEGNGMKEEGIFRQAKWGGGDVFYRSEIIGGKMENIFCQMDEISCSQFSDLHMEHIELRASDGESLGLFDNQFHSVIFHDVTIKSPMEDTYFENCDTGGLVSSIVHAAHEDRPARNKH